MPCVGEFQPSSSSYIGSHLERMPASVGKSSISEPSNLYPVQTFIFESLSSTSSFVTTRPSSPFTRAAYRRATASNQPHLLGLPVVAPYSPPCSRRQSASLPWSSVGDGPSPTLVQ